MKENSSKNEEKFALKKQWIIKNNNNNLEVEKNMYRRDVWGVKLFQSFLFPSRSLHTADFVLWWKLKINIYNSKNKEKKGR